MKKRYLIAGAYGLAGAALAAKLLRRPREVVWEEQAGKVPHAERSRFVEVDGVRVHYQEAGEEGATPVVLIHGFCASTFVWSDVFLQIAEMGFRVVVPDLVGFGFTEKPPRFDYTFEAQARAVVGLTEKLGIERAALVGSSYGGAVAAVCALDYPERVSRLVLVGAVSNDGVKRQGLLRLAASPVMGDVLSPILLDSPRLMRWRMSKVYAPENARLFAGERMEAHHRTLRSSQAHAAVLRTLRRWDAGRILAEAPRITQPTLLVWGEHDRDIPLSEGERLHALIPNSRLVVFENCGHLPQEERPEEFAGLVAGFCKTVISGG